MWAAGATYERYVGRWSRRVAADFLPWLQVAPGRRWLDVGSGTGILTRTILEGAEPSEVVGIDPSDGFLGHARAQTQDARARFELADARALPFDAATFDVVVSGLALNFVPDPAQAMAEMKRVVRPGGLVALYVWDYAGEMQMMRYCWDAAAALDPAARELDEGRRSPMCEPNALIALFVAAGLTRVAVREIVIPTVFRDFDDFWGPFLGGTGPAPAYIASLTPQHRDTLRERLRSTLPSNPDGSIPLKARAWAIRGARAG
jgi:SAM-dependent methyltransferase